MPLSKILRPSLDTGVPNVGFAVKKNSDVQTLSNNTWTKVTFDTELFDSLEQLTAYLEQNHSDLYLSAISSFECLELTMVAARSGKSLLLANKESLVVLGDAVINEAQQSNTDIIPIDSEHFSLFCSLRKMENKDINKVFITASGGPFIGQSIMEREKQHF